VTRPATLRWRLVAWVVGAMVIVSAVMFVVVYEQTGSQLRAQVNEDITGDVNQLSEAVRALRTPSPTRLTAQLRAYVAGQPSRGSTSLLFAVVPGFGTVTNHPELLGADRPDDGETAAEQQRENARGRALLNGPTGQRTLPAPDLGLVRVDERLISAAGVRVRLGAGESLQAVRRAQRSVVKSFLIAGALALLLVLIASYLAAEAISRPLRRMAKVAARVDDGDLHPRMPIPASAGQEVRVLAESFNHMLDRLAVAFAYQRDFVADASHELRTPLTVISGQLEVLAAQDHPSAEEVRRVQRLVSAEVARTSRLVDDMLLLARAEQHDFLRQTSIDLPGFVTDLWDTTTNGHQRRLDLGPIPSGTLSADPDRLAQALRNLIDNALAHTTAPDGRVGLEITVLSEGIVRFTVSDDGPGIPQPERERIFERFHRTDDARDRVAGGAGLGLAIVDTIAGAHGGQIRVLRSPLGGAQLELDIPGFRSDVRPRPYGARHSGQSHAAR
jgi:two-component system, OmpR family, sensor kinase